MLVFVGVCWCLLVFVGVCWCLCEGQIFLRFFFGVCLCLLVFICVWQIFFFWF